MKMPKVVTCRKEHECGSCHLSIPKGTKAKLQSYKVGRVSGTGFYWQTDYFHLHCNMDKVLDPPKVKKTRKVSRKRRVKEVPRPEPIPTLKPHRRARGQYDLNLTIYKCSVCGETVVRETDTKDLICPYCQGRGK